VWGVFTVSAQQKLPRKTTTIDMQWAVKIAARDGVKLNGDGVHAGTDQKDPAPSDLHVYTVHRRLDTDRAYILQAWLRLRAGGCAGTRELRGEFEPFVNEGKDGYDVVEWLAKQPYCNGKVTMWGGSYAGFDQ